MDGRGTSASGPRPLVLALEVSPLDPCCGVDCPLDIGRFQAILSLGAGLSDRLVSSDEVPDDALVAVYGRSIASMPLGIAIFRMRSWMSLSLFSSDGRRLDLRLGLKVMGDLSRTVGVTANLGFCGTGSLPLSTRVRALFLPLLSSSGIGVEHRGTLAAACCRSPRGAAAG